MSTRVPTPLPVRVGKEELAAVHQAGALLRDLGHEVIFRDPEYPASAILANYLPRYLRGISDEVDAQAHPERLQARTRNLARAGAFFSDRRMDAIRAPEPTLTTRIQLIFDDVDVVVTPGDAAGPSRVGAYQRRGAVSTLLLVAQRVPYQQIRNLTGQPAAAVPRDFDGRRLADRGAARRPAVRRSDAVVVVRADRSRKTVGPPATAGVMTPISLAPTRFARRRRARNRRGNRLPGSQLGARPHDMRQAR